MPTIKIRLGALEVDYEGEQAFIASGLLPMMRELGEMTFVAATGAVSEEEGQTLLEGRGGFGHTTSQIAQIANVSSGPDLAMAAAAHLTLVKGESHLQRTEILKEMKGAASFYSENHSSNLSSILNGLVKKKQLNPIGANVFALPNSIRKEYEKKLSSE